MGNFIDKLIDKVVDSTIDDDKVTETNSIILNQKENAVKDKSINEKSKFFFDLLKYCFIYQSLFLFFSAFGIDRTHIGVNITIIVFNLFLCLTTIAFLIAAVKASCTNKIKN